MSGRTVSELQFPWLYTIALKCLTKLFFCNTVNSLKGLEEEVVTTPTHVNLKSNPP